MATGGDGSGLGVGVAGIWARGVGEKVACGGGAAVGVEGEGATGTVTALGEVEMGGTAVGDKVACGGGAAVGMEGEGAGDIVTALPTPVTMAQPKAKMESSQIGPASFGGFIRNYLTLVNVCLWLIVSSYPCWIGCDGPPVIFGVSISVEVEVDFGILVGVKDLPDFDFSCISSRN